MTMHDAGYALVPALAVLAAACPGATEMARPDQPTASEALGENDAACEDGQVPEEGTPLVVNWRDDDRATLEAAMQSGVAVVRYSCEGIQVLRACRAPGDYGYTGVSRKTSVVTMRDRAEARANFGVGLSALRGIDASLAAGRTLNLAYVLVGMEATTASRISQGDLEGRCDGATHFVYDVSRGAFALDTSAGTEGKAAAEILGRGAAAGGEAQRDTQARDGDVDACQRSSAEDAEPVRGCRAPLRVSLFAIDADSHADTGARAGSRRDARSCPAGFVYTDDQCERAAGAGAHLCRAGDVAECQRQCEAGSAGSCGRLAAALNPRLTSDAGRDAIRAALDELEELENELRAACEVGEGPACSAVAYVRFRNLTGAQKQRNQREGMQFAEKGCLAGDADGCRLIRRAYTTDAGRIVGVDLDPGAFASILERGCARGAPLSCQYLAELYAMGYAVDRDLRTAAPLAERACRGDLAHACVLAAGLRLPGPRCAETLEHYAASAPRDATSDERAALPRVCRRTSPSPSEADALLARACQLGDETACGLSGR